MILKKKQPKDKYHYDWWGYLHKNGSIKIKSFYSEEELKEAKASFFVAKVIDPIKAINREQAEIIIIKKIEDYARNSIGRKSNIDNSGNRKIINIRLEA